MTHAHLEPIWYLSELSDVPYSPNQFLGWDFLPFLQHTGSNLLSNTKFGKIGMKILKH